jgi:hypothetical protein
MYQNNNFNPLGNAGALGGFNNPTSSAFPQRAGSLAGGVGNDNDMFARANSLDLNSSGTFPAQP